MRHHIILAACIGILLTIAAFRLFAESILAKGFCLSAIVILILIIRFISRNDNTESADTSSMDNSVRNDVSVDAHQESSSEEDKMVQETSGKD